MYNFVFQVISEGLTVVFCKKGVLRNFAKFTRELLCQSLFFNEVEIQTFLSENNFNLIPTIVVTNSILRLFCPVVETKSKNNIFMKLAVC